MSSLEKNQLHTVTIEGYSSEGMGIARIDGQVIFVQDGVRGETCRIQLLKVLKSIAFAKVVGVSLPSPYRRTPDCPYYGQCGGCSLRHLDYAEELWCKRQRVQDALTRLGGSSVQVESIHGSADTLHYRNKVQYPVSPAGEPGFYRARSHQVVPLTDCLIQNEVACRAAAGVADWLRQYQVSAYDETTGKGLLRHVYVRTNRKNEALICLICNGTRLPRERELVAQLQSACPEAVGILLGINTRRSNVILGERYRTLWGRSYLMDTLCGLEFRLSIPSFYQVNSQQAEILYARALAFADLHGTETVLDLYCGIGSISLVLASHAGRVIGAEIVEEAIADARENALRNHITNAEFFCADAGEIAQNLQEEGLHPDVVCVDPPRKGLLPGVAESIAAMAPQRIVYVSCDPATLARDCKLFAQLGYSLTAAEAVDMFPGTSHVETVVLLSKTKK